MKIPHRVRIKSKVAYDIVFADVIQNDWECLGLCDYDNKQIIIKSGQSNMQQMKTFFHELGHAVSWENEIELKHKDIYKLENALYNLIKLNKF